MKKLSLLLLIVLCTIISSCGSSCRKGDKWRKKRWVQVEKIEHIIINKHNC